MATAAADAAGESAAELLLRAAALVPLERYALAALVLASAFLYRFLELHVLGDLLRGLRGGRVALTFHPDSQVYHRVASKCRSLHGRYLATPWLASPHLQTLFLGIWGRPPPVTYRRQLYTVRDGGTIALDWLLASGSEAADVSSCDGTISSDDSTPIVVVVPGLTSDSTAAYVKHLAFSMASNGWNVVVGNHRGLGGISITSDCFYNGGWTEDIREVVNYLHQKYPEAPLFTVGTSLGANILVKYLGEEGESTPVAGAASICSPWDLLVTSRFISRKLVQRCYDKALAIGLKGYAKLHQPVLARLANWEAITSSRSTREFDHHATCVVAKYEAENTRRDRRRGTRRAHGRTRTVIKAASESSPMAAESPRRHLRSPLLTLLFLAAAAQIAMAAEPEQAPAAQEAAVHIVYVDRPEDADPEEFHIRTLAPVLGSEDKARDAVLYHYKHAASGFSAKLTTEQVEDLKKQPGVLQVVPSQTYQLHGQEGGHASTTRTMGLM